LRYGILTMQILLIGKNSYVGQSIVEIQNSGINWTLISRNDLDNFKDLNNKNTFDGVVVIATPAMADINFEWSLDTRVERFLHGSKLPIICISSIRADDDLTHDNRFYVNSLNSFEKIALENNWNVLRISNFLGMPPVEFVNQRKLLPWSILATIEEGNKLSLKSSSSQQVEWVTAEDVVAAIFKIIELGLIGNFVTRPSFEISLLETIEIMISKFRLTREPIEVSYGSFLRPKRLSIYDTRLVEVGWKSRTNVEVLLAKITHIT
jgi:hypothetical protein